MAINEIWVNGLFEKDEWPHAGAPPARKPLRFYLRSTPADPLSPGVKLVLWAAGFVVAALLVLVLLDGGPGSRARDASKTDVLSPHTLAAANDEALG
jgi:hypothetical protein